MALTTLRQILDHAAENGYGMPAFNVTNMETLLAVMRAAERTESPVIVQASQSARKYMDDVFAKHMFEAAAERFPTVPLCIHQDHGSSPDVCRSAMDLGFSSVMMDGSLEADGKTPASYDYNVDVTAKVVDIAHRRGVSVEGEIGVLGSLESGAASKKTGTVLKARSKNRPCSPIRRKRRTSSRRRASMLLPWPSARHTVPINSRDVPPATFWRSM